MKNALGTLLAAIAIVAGLAGAGYVGRLTAPPPIFYQKAHLLVVTMNTGAPRVMGIWATEPECKIQIGREIALLPTYAEASQFNTQTWVCQHVLLPVPRSE